MMNKNSSRIALATAALALVANTASAGYWPGSAGHQWPNPNCAPGKCGGAFTEDALQCFEHGHGLMENFCAATVERPKRLLVIPIEIANGTGFVAFEARFKGSGFTTALSTDCSALRINQNNGVFGLNMSNATPNMVTSNTTFVEFTNTDTMQFECQVAPVSGTNRGGVQWVRLRGV